MTQVLSYLGANLLITGVLVGVVAWIFWSWLRQVQRPDDKANCGLQSHPVYSLGCNYHLAGLPNHGSCPECGRPYDRRSRVAPSGDERL